MGQKTYNDTNKKVCDTCDNARFVFLPYLCSRKLKTINQNEK